MGNVILFMYARNNSTATSWVLSATDRSKKPASRNTMHCLQGTVQMCIFFIHSLHRAGKLGIIYKGNLRKEEAASKQQISQGPWDLRNTGMNPLCAVLQISNWRSWQPPNVTNKNQDALKTQSNQNNNKISERNVYTCIYVYMYTYTYIHIHIISI